MKLLKAALVLGLVLGLTAVPAAQDATAGPTNYTGPDKKEAKVKAGDTNRGAAIQKFDADGDWSFSKKEAKAFKEGRPNMYNQLVLFCDKAVETPRKFDVKFPPGVKAKKFKCKKKKVDRPYLKAWALRGKPVD